MNQSADRAAEPAVIFCKKNGMRINTYWNFVFISLLVNFLGVSMALIVFFVKEQKINC